MEDAETELRVASEMKAASITLTKASLENKPVCPSPVECPAHQGITGCGATTEARWQPAVSFQGKMQQICAVVVSEMLADHIDLTTGMFLMIK